MAGRVDKPMYEYHQTEVRCEAMDTNWLNAFGLQGWMLVHTQTFSHGNWPNSYGTFLVTFMRLKLEEQSA